MGVDIREGGRCEEVKRGGGKMSNGEDLRA